MKASCRDSQLILFLGYHKGTVWDLDPSWDSQYLLTAGSDGVARIFETITGKYIVKMEHRKPNGPVRAVSWSEGNHIFATASDPFTGKDASLISIFQFPSEDVRTSGMCLCIISKLK